jgi:hypothetical protein
LDNLTKGKYHGKIKRPNDYYSDPTIRKDILELFANLFRLYSKNQQKSVQFLKDYCPDLIISFDELLNEIF